MMFLSYWICFKSWLITKLGGCVTHHTPELGYQLVWQGYDSYLQQSVARACEKVRKDPGFSAYSGTNLGRNILRDEACEWTKLYLKEVGRVCDDSEVHLACEIYYHRCVKGLK